MRLSSPVSVLLRGAVLVALAAPLSACMTTASIDRSIATGSIAIAPKASGAHPDASAPGGATATCDPARNVLCWLGRTMRTGGALTTGSLRAAPHKNPRGLSGVAPFSFLGVERDGEPSPDGSGDPGVGPSPEPPELGVSPIA